ncbi:inosine/xanthosine triphosphatase [Fulvivirga aurantia]|uniref:inosine/xanthosine triphosphatase n=1 Tax=Fulvivirga aurantia TaxID=2529383 RepID=UPI001CA4097F|nr:inosine/xanthosine triphosphatase [Fulvivirga aurantia]
MKVAVASNNPVKTAAVANGMAKMFSEKAEIINVSAPSEVKDQPTSDQETYDGAFNRAKNARDLLPDQDLWVGIEGGIEDTLKGMTAFAWVVVLSKDKIGHAKSATFFLPEKVSHLIKQGKELGEADDIVFGKSNSKQQNGAVGLLTENAIDRTSYYTEAMILALIPFKNTELY